MTTRRVFLGTLAGGLLAAPLAGEAQQPGKVWRIGFLGVRPLTDPTSAASWEVFRQTLQEHGYVEGRNVAFERRFSAGDNARNPVLAAELVRLKVDVLVAAGGPGVLAAKEATATIPIVMVGASDPVGMGLVTSLARPGGNVTGMSDYLTDLTPKRIELLKTVAPRVTRVGYLTNAAGWEREPARLAAIRKRSDAAAQALGMTLFRVELNAPSEFDSATAAILRGRPDALLLAPTSTNGSLRKEIAEFAIKQGLPSSGGLRHYAVAGVLMSYGPIADEYVRGAATYVARILNGAKPGDLPIQQPTKFELVINLKTAKALGLTIPQSVLGRADEVIE
jgi:putative ABC transport system substrate-binding protein